MNQCRRCGPTENLMVRGKSYCRPCNNEAGKSYYAANREHRLKCVARNVAVLRKKRREQLDEIKKKPCMDCGGEFPPYVMDFDHRIGETKIECVSTMVPQRGMSMKRLLLEIEKCDLVCANCHRIRTHERRVKEVQVLS